MGHTVTYHCPHCGAYVELEREGHLSDRSVTPFPLKGWEYVTPEEEYEDETVDGVVFSCGEDGTLADGETGCGEQFYLSFVRFEQGVRKEPLPETERVEPGENPWTPAGLRNI